MFCILQKLPVHLKLIFPFPDVFCFVHLILDQICTIKDGKEGDLVKTKSSTGFCIFQILFMYMFLGKKMGGCMNHTGDKAHYLVKYLTCMPSQLNLISK